MPNHHHHHHHQGLGIWKMGGGKDKHDESDKGLFSHHGHGMAQGGPGYPPGAYPPPPGAYPPQGYPPAGYPQQGYPPAGYPHGAHPPAGYPGSSGTFPFFLYHIFKLLIIIYYNVISKNLLWCLPRSSFF